MLQQKILVRKALGAVDAGRSGAVAVEEVTALAHEVGDLFPFVNHNFVSIDWPSTKNSFFPKEPEQKDRKTDELGSLEERNKQKVNDKTYNTVELAPLVPLRPAKVVLALARAELAEVLGRLGDDVFEELKGDAAEGLAAEGDVEEDAVECLVVSLIIFGTYLARLMMESANSYPDPVSR